MTPFNLFTELRIDLYGLDEPEVIRSDTGRPLPTYLEMLTTHLGVDLAESLARLILNPPAPPNFRKLVSMRLAGELPELDDPKSVLADLGVALIRNRRWDKIDEPRPDAFKKYVEEHEEILERLPVRYKPGK